MADPRFFSNSGPFTLGQIAENSGAQLACKADDSFLLNDVAPLDGADASHLSFLDNKKYKESFAATKAGACIVHPDLAGLAPAHVKLLLSRNPYKSYALAAQLFYPTRGANGVVSPYARIEDGVHLGVNVEIHAGAVIAQGAHIGDGTIIESNVVIGPNVVIGQGCYIGANSSVSHANIGRYVRLYPGVRIGQDGFGFAIDPSGFVKVPQLGRVIIEDHVEVGANSTIDRGAGPDTVIGMGTWIDNLVQIGHNVKIGRGCVIVSQVGISGSTVLEDFVMLGGQVGLAGHLRIGKGARIAAQSGVSRNIPPQSEYMGYPAVPMKQFLRQTIHLERAVRRSNKEE